MSKVARRDRSGGRFVGLERLAVAVLCVVVAGCASPDQRTDRPSNAPAEPSADAESDAYSATRSGVIIHRLAGDGTFLRYEGDCPSFWFDVPSGVRELVAVLNWSSEVDQDVVMDLRSPNGTRLQSWDSAAEFDPSPIEIRGALPEEGLWFGYVGPGIAGASVTWDVWVTWVGVGEAAFAGLEPERLRDSEGDCRTLRHGVRNGVPAP